MTKSPDETAAELGIPWTVAQPSLVAYRSAGIGVFGAVTRYAGMPLEKIALYMNSSQVSGKGQLRQAVHLTFQEGALAPYRVVGPASLTAWFLQYSVMGIAFQFCDQALSHLLGVRPVYFGRELMEPPVVYDDEPLEVQIRSLVKTVASPVLAASMESFVSNRAECQRYFGPVRFAEIEQRLGANVLLRQAGPAFFPNAMRNIIMCQTSFLLTPLTYKNYFPQELKNKTTLFWYGLSLNIFAGNVIAITQQALWGRSLDYLAQNGRIQYSQVVRQGLAKDGMAAFFTGPKWFSRVLMNAPAQGTLPWFYNEILPIPEPAYLRLVKYVYDHFLTDSKHPADVPARRASRGTLRRMRSNIGSLPTAHVEIKQESDTHLTKDDLAAAAEHILKDHHVHLPERVVEHLPKRVTRHLPKTLVEPEKPDDQLMNTTTKTTTRAAAPSSPQITASSPTR